MAIKQALQIIDQSWTEIEPRLTVRELSTLAAIEYSPMRTGDLSETVFSLLAPALPVEHPAWPALRSSGTRFVPAQQESSLGEVIRRCIARARAALANPSIADDAAADFLVESMTSRVIRAGVVTEQEFSGTVPLTIEYQDQRLYPRFQFTGTAALTVHQIVGQVNEMLGGDEDPLGAVGWWLAQNAWLGMAPAQLLGTGRDAEIQHAASQLANDSW